MANTSPEAYLLPPEWTDENQKEFGAARDDLLIEAARFGGLILGRSFRENEYSLYAAMSLVQDGHMTLDPATPRILRLTNSGQELAIATSAVRRLGV